MSRLMAQKYIGFNWLWKSSRNHTSSHKQIAVKVVKMITYSVWKTVENWSMVHLPVLKGWMRVHLPVLRGWMRGLQLAISDEVLTMRKQIKVYTHLHQFTFIFLHITGFFLLANKQLAKVLYLHDIMCSNMSP